MRKNFIIIIMLCIAQAGFAQVKVDNVGNAGIGNDPLANTKLRLYYSTTTKPTVPTFGLHSILEDFGSNSTQPMYGAYFKNTRSNGGPPPTNQLYGVYVDNTHNANGKAWGMYLKNTRTQSGSGEMYGIQVINEGTVAPMYGLHLSNTLNINGNVYGIYTTNVKSSASGAIYGIWSASTSTNTSQSGSVYGAHLSVAVTSTGANASAYGLYATVSGGSSSKRYAGYFDGGKVQINGELWAWDLTSTLVRITSDERLKSDIKPLSDEREKLYLLQGKSYKKVPPPITGLAEDSLTEKRETVEMPEIQEYGYLAQELKEVFPDLVSQDSAGYYAVNYIGLIPIIVEALKDQRSEIEKQREQIKQLVKLIDIKSINEKAFEENGIESIPILLQNTPNPFNQATEIGYYIPENVNSANIYIYDINGFQQKNIAITERGSGATTLQASALQAGIYFYTLICDGKPVDTKQMILTK